MINNILQKVQSIFLVLLLGVSFASTTQGQTVQVLLDSNCLAQISLIDSVNNQIISNNPPYYFSVANMSYNSNSVANTTVDLSNAQNGIYTVQIIDGSQNSYTTSLSINCGATPPSTPPIVSTTNNASNCNQCDAVATFQITNPIAPPYTFTWSDGFVHTGAASVQRNNLCPGVYTVYVQNTVNNNYSIAVTIGCNNGTAPQNATCYQSLTLDLGSNASRVLHPQDLSFNPVGNGNSAYIITSNGNIVNYYNLTCANLGYNNVTLLLIDSVLQTADTCHVLLNVTDTLGVCNGSGNLNYQIQGTSSNASICNTCDGMYVFQNIIDSVGMSIAPAPYSFLWSDGSTQGPTRINLCPNQNYVLNVADANGNVYSKTINVGCNNPAGNVCIDTTKIDNSLLCTSIIAPVCGCDSITYQNACIAEYHHGITSWTSGVCGANNLVLSVNTTPSFCDTINNCTGSAIVSVVAGGVGGYTYVWNDTTITTATANNLCADTYTVTVTDSNGNVGFAFVVIGNSSCVWPGDADDNTIANNFDLLPIALEYNLAGFSRINATTNWTAQPAQDWQASNILGLPNPKHIDCDGNGFIDTLDVDVILLNYGQSYSRSTTSLFGNIPFLVESATASLGDTLSLDILLGDQVNQVTNAYAVAFTLNYDTAVLVPSTILASFDNSWLGNDLLEIQKDFSTAGQVEIAIGRKTKTPISGFGPIGSIAFTIKDDVIIGKVNMNDSTITATIGISSIRLIDHQNNEIGTNPQTCMLEISERVSINKINNKLDIQLFPNPTKGILNIQSKAVELFSVSLYNAAGQLVYQQENLSSNHQISTDNLPSGVYFISIQTNKGVYNNKVQVIR